MTANDRNNKREFDAEKLTDMQSAFLILRLLDDNPPKPKATQGAGSEKDLVLEMARNALGTMTNPFARKLLLNEMAKR